MTARDSVEFTMQRYYVPGADEFTPDTPWAVRSLAAGIDANGRERLFCSFSGVKSGYVFEIDSGNTLDGETIPFRAELNPISFGGMSQLVRLERSFIAATGYGYAPINVARKINMRPFEPVDYGNTEPFLLGRREYRATIEPQPLRGKFDFPVEGYEFSLLFSGNSSIEGPHTLQMLWVNSDKRGTSRGNRGE